jgi:hypothetical protein
VPFNAANFTSFEARDDGGRKRTLCFIDGGNMSIFSAPNFSLQYARIYFNLFTGNLRKSPSTLPQRIEFIVKASARVADGSILYTAECLPLHGTDPRFLPAPFEISSLDKTIALENVRADIELVGGIARRFAEWKYAHALMENELDDGDVLVRDGALQTLITGERDYAEKLYAAAEKKNALVAGLAKTSTMLTTTGIPLVAALQKLAEDSGIGGCWYYHPLAENIATNRNHRADLYVCKLHPKSAYAFYFELYLNQAKKMSSDETVPIFSALARNSSDLSFLGYPYGLIDADANARVTTNEAATLRAVLVSELSNSQKWKTIAKFMAATDAHDILNRL